MISMARWGPTPLLLRLGNQLAINELKDRPAVTTHGMGKEGHLGEEKFSLQRWAFSASFSKSNSCGRLRWTSSINQV